MGEGWVRELDELDLNERRLGWKREEFVGWEKDG